MTDTTAETVTYTATDTTDSVPIGTAQVQFTPGTASQLAWQTQPGGGASGTGWSQQPVIRLEDASGNLETGDNSDSVTVALTTANGATLSGTNTVTVSGGIATFSGLSVDKTGSYTLTATSGGITSPVSSSFSITAGSVGYTLLSVPPTSVPG